MYYGSIAWLPTRTNIRPSTLEGSEYFDSHYDAVVVVRDAGTGKTAAVPVTLAEADEYEVGQRLGAAHHDQAGYILGFDFRVVGVSYRSAEDNRGEVPTRKVPFWVFK